MNATLFEQVNAYARETPWLHPLITVYAGYGVVVFVLLLGAGWWSARRSGEPRRMAAAVCAGAATLLAVGINQPIVDAVHEARPYSEHPTALVLATRSTDFSFPSDHAVMAGAVAVGLVFVSRRLAALAGVAALAMAFARVYIAAHYPADVAVGLLLGAAAAGMVYLVAHRVTTAAVTALVDRGSPLRPLLTAAARRHGKPSMTGLPDRLLAVSGRLLYVLVAAVVLLEDALFVGFVVPGETAAVLGVARRYLWAGSWRSSGRSCLPWLARRGCAIDGF